MAKLATLSALLLLVMVTLASATTYTTITTTTIDGEPTNPRGRGSQCQEEEIRVQKISHCRMLMQCEGGSRPHESLRMVVMNPIASKSQCEQQHLEMCCDQLGDIKEDCRCQAIEKMVMQQGTQQRREMMQMAQDLPNRCDMKPRQCEMQGPRF